MQKVYNQRTWRENNCIPITTDALNAGEIRQNSYEVNLTKFTS